MTTERKPILCLFRFRDLYVIAESYTRGAEDEEDSYDYLFHSHQCPVNIMRNVLEVFDSAEGKDPHGIFRYVAEIDDNEQNRTALRDKGGFQDMLYLFKTDGTEAPTQWPEKERGLLPWIAALQDDAKTKA